MNFRITFVLAVLAVVVGGYVVFFELQKTTERETQPLWFYNVHDDDIRRISVTHQDETLAFIKGTGEEFQWFFDDGTDTEVDLDRWGGIPLLVTGPRSRRVLEERIDDPIAYGLEPPLTVIEVSLFDGRELSVRIGDNTPDNTGSYAQLAGFPTLFLIDVSWGEVLSRLVTEPPVPPPPLEEVVG
ncbi:MAG: DUF4340 domain-containing protein [Chloroflexi bacterium]|nr:DUF4340 domain-containing protein [Chloroflexota bacterium]